MPIPPPINHAAETVVIAGGGGETPFATNPVIAVPANQLWRVTDIIVSGAAGIGAFLTTIRIRNAATAALLFTGVLGSPVAAGAGVIPIGLRSEIRLAGGPLGTNYNITEDTLAANNLTISVTIAGYR
ncbi:MAG: hypothetical protein ABID40_04895 [Candidatus Bipolaricaulota bacterium]